MTEEELKEKVSAKLNEVLAGSSKNYCEGRNHASYSILTYDAFGVGGRLLLVMWPGDECVDVCWSPKEATYSDLGTVVGSVSTHHFKFGTVRDMIIEICNKFVEE